MTEAPQDNQGQQTTDFGTSEYGERLVYKEEGCCVNWRDRGWAIFFYIHCVFMLFLAIFLPIDLEAKGFSFAAIASYFNLITTYAGDILGSLFGKIIGIVIIQCIVGIIFGLCWLKVIQKIPKLIIKIMLFVYPVLFIIFGIFFIGQDSKNGMGPAICCFIICALFCLYAYCVWKKIPFSAALLSIASKITQTFEGTICISLAVIPINVIWGLLWNFIYIMVFIGYILRIVTGLNESYNNGTAYQAPTGEMFGVFFLLLISYYWVMYVARNVSHCAACGVSATWYFSKEVSKPTMPALKRTLTTSFGSICLGSLIVSIIQALRSMLRSMKRTCCGCIILCCLCCLEKLIRYFNLYAYCQCAIYGTSFIQSAKATFALFQSKGFSAVINDTLTSLPLTGGGLISLVICFFSGYGLTFAFFTEPFWKGAVPIIAIYMGFYGGLLGYFSCYSIFFPVQSSIMTLFVCFAEDPNALKETHPDEFGELTSTNEPLNKYVQVGHTGIDEDGNEEKTGQEMQPPPQQTQ